MAHPKTLEDAALAFVPLPGKVPNRLDLDAYLSVIANIKFLWSVEGIVVSRHHEAKAKQALADGYVFINEQRKKT